MEHLLKFKMRMSLLTTEEFNQLLTSFDKDYLINVLFKLLHQSFIPKSKCLSFKDNVSFINNTIQKIDKIIYSRENNHNEHDDDLDIDIQTSNKVIKLDELSLPIISLISGFLQFKDMISFEKTNKTIFIGTRSPLSLQKLDEETFTKCIKYSHENSCIYNWFRFRNIKSVTLDADEVDELYYDDEHPKYKDENMEILHLPIWKSVTKLTFTNSWTNQTIDHILSNKTCLQNLEYLLWPADEELFNEKTSLRLPQLQGFGATVGTHEYVAEKLDKEKFKSFHGWCSDLGALHDNHKAHQLQELCLFDPRSKSNQDEFLAKERGDLYSGFRNLKRLSINFGDMTTYNYNFIMNDLFVSNIDTLEYIGITCQYKTFGVMESKYVMKLLQHSLNKIINCKSRLTIKIRGNGVGEEGLNALKEQTQEYIQTLTDLLSQKIKDFMLILNIDGIYKELKDKLDTNKYLINTGICENGYCYISNKECAICGYNGNWMMKCKNCE